MKFQFTMVAMGVAMVLGVAPAPSFGLGDVGFVNVAGTVPGAGGGDVILVELKNAGGTVVGSSSYTTANNDTEEKIADKLDQNFVGAGFTANHMKDKNDGTEVIEYKRKKDGGQPFDIVITNAEGSVTVTSKATSNDKNANCSAAPSEINLGSCSAAVTLTGTNTVWQSGIHAVTGLSFADGITVDSFLINSNTQIVANISWGPGTVPGIENVDVLGNYVADDSTPLTNVVHDVCMPAVQYVGDACPTLSQWGVGVMTLLVLTAATVVMMRRRAVEM